MAARTLDDTEVAEISQALLIAADAYENDGRVLREDGMPKIAETFDVRAHRVRALAASIDDSEGVEVVE